VLAEKAKGFSLCSRPKIAGIHHAGFDISPWNPCGVLELLDTVRAWQRDGRPVALATLVSVQHSAPRDPGAVFAVSGDGRLAGSISGGCVEAALVDEAQAVLRDERARVVSYGLSDSEAQAVGLTCGGTLRIAVEPLDPAFCQALEDRVPNVLALALRLDEAGVGRRLAVFKETTLGTLGSAALDHALATEIREGGAVLEPHVRMLGKRGEPHGDVELFVDRVAVPPEMYVFGAIDYADAMVRMGQFLGYRVTVIDARPAFATAERFPGADRVAVAWPHEFLAGARVDERTAIIALTHDEKFDIPLLLEAIRTKAGYIGAMGSRNTHAARIDRLGAAGATDAELARLNAPIGLDLGARTPEETALAIAAEIVALRHGRSGGRLTGGTGRLRGTV
jgi:xanthine dehydrogenase accessory factor